MKKVFQSYLQRILGFENYLYYFSIAKTSFFKGSTYEAEFFEFLKLIPQGSILDIGANIGITTVPLAKKFSNFRIHAFEPIPSNNAALKRVIKYYKLPNVQLHNVALGEKAGELKLVVPIINNVRMQGLSHAYVEGQDEEWNRGDIYNIPMMKLDDVAALKEEKKIAAIKIDVENFEYYVLKGAKQLLRQHTPVIYCELWDNDMRQPVMDLLTEMGYRVKVFIENRLIEYTNQPLTNFVFTHRNMD